MALDVGDVRIGIAVSDPLGMMAHAHSVVNAEPEQDAIRAIADLVRELSIQYVVSGLPLNLKGEEGPQARKVRAFNEKLQTVLEIAVTTQDERFTTALVERAMVQSGMRRKKRKQTIDQLAAQQILQSHLDRRSINNETTR